MSMLPLRHRLLVAWLVLGAAPAAAQQPVPRPLGVTDSAIAWGRRLFHGSANCAACHGNDAQGTGDGPALTGALWLHGPGTYEWLVEQIKRGIPAHQTWTRKPMPMRGWTNMPDEDVRGRRLRVVDHASTSRDKVDAPTELGGLSLGTGPA
jgi:mono/diheme cytochrome c family protein